MEVALYLYEPEEGAKDPKNPPQGRAWFRAWKMPPLTNDEYRAWEAFLPQSAHSRYHYCSNCGNIEELDNGGYGVNDRLLPPEVVGIKERCVNEGNAQWLTLRASPTKQNALFAIKEGGTFLVAQWGEKEYTSQEVVAGARAKERVADYAGQQLPIAVLSALGGGMISMVLAKLFSLPNNYLLWLVGIVIIVVGVVSFSMYELAKRKLRKKFSFMF